MINVKWGIISGGAAFVLALLSSLLVGHTGLMTAFFRALGFAALFFGMGIGVWALINTFIPDLLLPQAHHNAVENFFPAETSGSRVNITVGGTSGAALPDTDGNTSGKDDVGNIADLISGAIKPAAKDIDQKPASGYTETADDFALPEDGPAEAGGGQDNFSMLFGGGLDFSDSSGKLTDTDSMADSFPFSAGENNQANTVEYSSPERKVSGNKAEKFEGDFNPKEIAAGIRTVLERDKKG